jgi:hypothetical protein
MEEILKTVANMVAAVDAAAKDYSAKYIAEFEAGLGCEIPPAMKQQMASVFESGFIDGVTFQVKRTLQAKGSI